MRGRFIVVEGGDGSGKGGVVARIAAALAEDGHTVLATREPGGTPEGLQLRALLLAQSGAVWDVGAELLLMVAARIQHVRHVILPALDAGQIVVCDRFIASTLAYQGGGRGVHADLIRTLHRRLVDDLWPDLTILLDVDPQIGLRRSRARLADAAQDEGRFEALDLAFHERVRQSFLSEADIDRDMIKVDASQLLEVVQDEAVRIVRSRMVGGATGVGDNRAGGSSADPRASHEPEDRL